nr:hypothetical protein [Ktedonobacteraceae bacterium]
GTVVTSAQAPEALLAIAAVCQQRQARLVRVGPVEADPVRQEVIAGRLPELSYRYQLERRLAEGQQRFSIYAPEQTYADLETPLLGQHQLENATTALAALELLRAQGVSWHEDALRAGFLAVRWAARMDVIGHDPTIVVDGAHNADSMRKLLAALRASFAFQRLLLVLGVNSDKDLMGIARELADVDAVVLTRMMNPRAATIEQLQAAFAEHAPQVEMHSASTSRQAMDLAVGLAGARDMICATGSLYIAGEVLRWAAARGDEIAAATIEGVDHSG